MPMVGSVGLTRVPMQTQRTLSPSGAMTRNAPENAAPPLSLPSRPVPWTTCPGCGSPTSEYTKPAELVGPVGPVGPVTVLPGGPVTPVGPVGPVAPVTPCGPVGPVAPLAPVCPVGPVGHALLHGAGGPGRPLAPFSPVGPLGPVAPAPGPVAPVAPLGPVAPAPGPVAGSGFTFFTFVAGWPNTPISGRKVRRA